MEINPGGRIDTRDIVGREAEVARYWKIVDRQGLVLSAERRIGKTHILWKMHEDGREGFLTVYQDLEGIHDVLELVRSIYTAVAGALSCSGRILGNLGKAWTSLVPDRIGHLDLPKARDNWKALMRMAFDDLAANLEDGYRYVFLWDELPLMLFNLQPEVSIQLLDVLRAVRQKHGDKLRFVFTGSIGLHLVLRRLRRAGNANCPVNDMYPETVPPMSLRDSVELARQLIGRLEQQPADPDALAARIADVVEGFPYYIQHVVDQLDQLSHPPAADDLQVALDALVFGDQDPAHFRYYIDRLDTYYDSAECANAKSVLDIIARSNGPLSIAAIGDLVRHNNLDVDDDTVRATVQLLCQDHYLAGQGSNGHRDYHFRWKLVKRWWRENH